MRTTVDLDGDLLAQAKRAGVDGGRSLSKVVEDALRVYLARRETAAERGPVRLPVFDGQLGVQPGVDLQDKDGLSELLDLPDEQD